MLKRPIPLFELPVEELQLGTESPKEEQLTEAQVAALEVSAGVSPPPARGGEQAEVAAAAGRPAGSAAASSGTCSTCGPIPYEGLEEWRQHFRSDLHRYNLKRRTAELGPVSELEFEALVDQEDVGSISGSDDDSDSDTDDDTNQQSAAGPSSTSSSVGGSLGLSSKQPHFVFGPACPGGPRLAVWRALVAPDRDLPSTDSRPQPSVQDCMAALRQLREQGGQFAIIMLRGGHFAAAVFGLQPQKAGNAKLSEKERFPVLAHKSAHRYVVRAGQGGKQSAKDASGKYARSAGSRLRRYNEAALQRDVEEALRGPLREPLAACNLIFLHAPGSNGQQLLGGEAPVLDRADPRLRRVPFTTRRPTLSEAQRVMRVLVSVWALAPEEEETGRGGGQQEQAGTSTAESEAAAEAEQARREQQRAAAASQAAQAAAAQAAAEEEARRKRAEKKARQKAKQQQQRREQAAAARREDDGGSSQQAGGGDEDEILAAAAQVAAVSSRLEAKPAPVGSRAKQQQGGKASAGGAAPRLAAMSKPKAGEDSALRRARLAAAAEQRMSALQAAMKEQQLH